MDIRTLGVIPRSSRLRDWVELEFEGDLWFIWLTYPDSVRCDDEIRRCGCAVFERDGCALWIHIYGSVIDFEGARGAITWFFEGGFEEFFVQVNSVEIVVILLISESRTRKQGNKTNSPKSGLVIPKPIGALDITTGPIVHDQFLQNNRFRSLDVHSPLL